MPDSNVRSTKSCPTIRQTPGDASLQFDLYARNEAPRTASSSLNARSQSAIDTRPFGSSVSHQDEQVRRCVGAELSRWGGERVSDARRPTWVHGPPSGRDEPPRAACPSTSEALLAGSTSPIRGGFEVLRPDVMRRRNGPYSVRHWLSMGWSSHLTFLVDLRYRRLSSQSAQADRAADGLLRPTPMRKRSVGVSVSAEL